MNSHFRAHKWIAVAYGVCGAGVFLYVLYRKGVLRRITCGDKKKRLKIKVEDMTKEQVHQMLLEIIKSQDQITHNAKVVTKECLQTSLSFEQTYQSLKELQPENPLKQNGLSEEDFTQLLQIHQHDPSVREAFARIMGAPNPSNSASDRVQKVTVRLIIEIHRFMYEILENLTKYFLAKPDKGSYDMKIVVVAVQCLVGSKIEAKFSMTSEELESAVLNNHTMLAMDEHFRTVSLDIQNTMKKLTGNT